MSRAPGGVWETGRLPFLIVHARFRLCYNRTHMMKKTLLLFVAALVAAFTLSAFPLLGGNSPAVGLEGRSDFFFNADSRLGIDEVSDAGHASRFTPVGSRTIWVGRQAPAGWLRFPVPASDLGPGYGDAKAGETRAPVASCRARAFPSSSINVDLYIPG